MVQFSGVCCPTAITCKPSCTPRILAQHKSVRSRQSVGFVAVLLAAWSLPAAVKRPGLVLNGPQNMTSPLARGCRSGESCALETAGQRGTTAIIVPVHPICAALLTFCFKSRYGMISDMAYALSIETIVRHVMARQKDYCS